MRKNITLYDDQYKFYETFQSTNLLVAFVEYMFIDKEPTNLNETEQVLFDSLRMRMENQKKKSDAWSKWWTNSHGGWRPQKQANEQTENKQTTNKKQTQNKQKTSKKQTENKQDKEEDIRIRDNNKIIISSSNEEDSVAEYWNEEVNECMNLIKKFNNWIINGSEKKWRQYSSNLIKKLKNIESVKEWKFTRQQILEMILNVCKENEFHSTKITSPELIYYNLSTLMDVCRKEFRKQQQGSNQITLHAL